MKIIETKPIVEKMLISISYYLGDGSETKYFDTYEDAVLFIQKIKEVSNSEFLHVDFYVYTGKEEARVIKAIEKIKEEK